MKKLVLSAVFTVGFCIFGFATNKIELQLDSYQKEESKNQSKKIQRYDFSLFKFVKPLPKKQEKDSTKTSDELIKGKYRRVETAYHQEKPLAFLMFS